MFACLLISAEWNGKLHKIEQRNCTDLLNCWEMEVFIQAFTWRLWRLVPLN